MIFVKKLTQFKQIIFQKSGYATPIDPFINLFLINFFLLFLLQGLNSLIRNLNLNYLKKENDYITNIEIDDESNILKVMKEMVEEQGEK